MKKQANQYEEFAPEAKNEEEEEDPALTTQKKESKSPE